MISSTPRGLLASALIRRRTLFLVMLLVLTVSPRGSGGQQVTYAASVGPELDSVTQSVVAREIALARDRSLPVEPLFAKVREGRLKSAKGTQIRTAVARLAARLDSARAALGPASTAEELIAGADALNAGAGTLSLRELRAATNGRTITAPIGTLAQLVASGVQPHRAVQMIVELLRHNASPTQLAALGNLVEGDVSSGLRPEESATIRMRGIEGTLGSTGDKTTAASQPTTPPPPATSPPPRRKP